MTSPDDKNSETPRTDAFVRSYAGVECYRIVPNLTDLARQLERELAESKRDVNTLNETLRLAGWGQGEIDSTAADVQERLEASAPSADGRGQARATYAKANPLGGPANTFDAIAQRIRAGEEYHAVLADYDLQHVSLAREQQGALREDAARYRVIRSKLCNGESLEFTRLPSVRNLAGLASITETDINEAVDAMDAAMSAQSDKEESK